jgi:hypothetical protein
MSEVNNTDIYREQEVVWAKIEGYPWWPGYIESINVHENEYIIKFIGDNNHSCLAYKNIKKYKTFYNKFTRQIKVRNLSLAIKIADEIYSGRIEFEDQFKILNFSIKNKSKNFSIILKKILTDIKRIRPDKNFTKIVEPEVINKDPFQNFSKTKNDIELNKNIQILDSIKENTINLNPNLKNKILTLRKRQRPDVMSSKFINTDIIEEIFPISKPRKLKLKLKNVKIYSNLKNKNNQDLIKNIVTPNIAYSIGATNYGSSVKSDAETLIKQSAKENLENEQDFPPNLWSLDNIDKFDSKLDSCFENVKSYLKSHNSELQLFSKCINEFGEKISQLEKHFINQNDFSSIGQGRIFEIIKILIENYHLLIMNNLQNQSLLKSSIDKMKIFFEYDKIKEEEKLNTLKQITNLQTLINENKKEEEIEEDKEEDSEKEEKNEEENPILKNYKNLWKFMKVIILEEFNSNLSLEFSTLENFHRDVIGGSYLVEANKKLQKIQPLNNREKKRNFIKNQIETILTKCVIILLFYSI